MAVDGVITLVKKSYGRNAAGGLIWEETERDVFCSIRSVSRTEFYEASQNGIPPTYVFTTNPINYEGEDTLIYGGFRYGITRTYTASLDEIELYAALIPGENKEITYGSNESGQ